MSNRIELLLKNIQFQTDLTIEQIAKKIGYTRQHLSLAAKTGENEKVYKLLQSEFSEKLHDAIKTDTIEHKTTSAATVSNSRPHSIDKPATSEQTSTMQALLKLIDQNEILVKANAQAIAMNDKMTDELLLERKAIANAAQQSRAVSKARFDDFLVLIVALSNGEKFASIEEADAFLNSSRHEHSQRGETIGTPRHSDKESKTT